MVIITDLNSFEVIMTTITIDFKTKPLSVVKTLGNLSEWKNQINDMLIANCVASKNNATISTETQVKETSETTRSATTAR